MRQHHYDGIGAHRVLCVFVDWEYDRADGPSKTKRQDAGIGLGEPLLPSNERDMWQWFSQDLAASLHFSIQLSSVGQSYPVGSMSKDEVAARLRTPQNSPLYRPPAA